MIDGISKEIASSLADFIDDSIRFAQIILNWPEANQTLRYPCLSILPGKPDFTPEQPSELSIRDESLTATFVKYRVGTYDFRIKINIWCRSRAERDSMQERVFQAFYSQNDNGSVSLELKQYHNVKAGFSLNAWEYVDSEEATQRKEWRVSFDVLSNCISVVEKSINLMKTIELDETIGEDITISDD